MPSPLLAGEVGLSGPGGGVRSKKSDRRRPCRPNQHAVLRPEGQRRSGLDGATLP